LGMMLEGRTMCMYFSVTSSCAFTFACANRYSPTMTTVCFVWIQSMRRSFRILLTLDLLAYLFHHVVAPEINSIWSLLLVLCLLQHVLHGAIVWHCQIMGDVITILVIWNEKLISKAPAQLLIYGSHLINSDVHIVKHCDGIV
jgi:hypothetical protein